MWNYPRNTCSCLKEFGWVGETRQPPNSNFFNIAGIAPHVRHGAQPALPVTSGPPAPLRLGREKEYNCWECFAITMFLLLTERNRNDEWLRTTARAASGKLCIASARTKARRDTAASSSYRACRCGADVDTRVYEPEVLLCMGCEGIWILQQKNTPGSKYQSLRQDGRPRRTAPNSVSRTTGDMRLRRPRENFSDERAY